MIAEETVSTSTSNVLASTSSAFAISMNVSSFGTLAPAFDVAEIFRGNVYLLGQFRLGQSANFPSRLDARSYFDCVHLSTP